MRRQSKDKNQGVFYGRRYLGIRELISNKQKEISNVVP
jgi:hypothetical protein